jgi:hypothetical protein
LRQQILPCDLLAVLELISERETTMRVTSALVGGGGRIPLEHLTRPPTRETHQIALLSAIGKPCVRETVP